MKKISLTGFLTWRESEGRFEMKPEFQMKYPHHDVITCYFLSGRKAGFRDWMRVVRQAQIKLSDKHPSISNKIKESQRASTVSQITVNLLL
ncbi:hypothetical protein FJP68_13050 [Pantoea vagans]|nr:hypothetical protein FJP68_13050 [Pantoea vagans]